MEDASSKISGLVDFSAQDKGGRFCGARFGIFSHVAYGFS